MKPSGPFRRISRIIRSGRRPESALVAEMASEKILMVGEFAEELFLEDTRVLEAAREIHSAMSGSSSMIKIVNELALGVLVILALLVILVMRKGSFG